MKFIDLMLQSPEGSEFWILHTVSDIPVQVPAMAYSMTINAEADNYYFASQDFELVENGPLWNLRLVERSATPL
jgi:hypothetical protein